VATRSATQTVQTPGAPAAEDLPVDGEQDQAAVIAALQAQLAAQTAETERLRAAPAAVLAAATSMVYEPQTPHAAEKLAMSPTARMTVAEVMAQIDAGKLAEPVNSYLCRDGYYARRPAAL
jgi:hypothetical protein